MSLELFIHCMKKGVFPHNMGNTKRQISPSMQCPSTGHVSGIAENNNNKQKERKVSMSTTNTTTNTAIVSRTTNGTVLTVNGRQFTYGMKEASRKLLRCDLSQWLRNPNEFNRRMEDRVGSLRWKNIPTGSSGLFSLTGLVINRVTNGVTVGTPDMRNPLNYGMRKEQRQLLLADVTTWTRNPNKFKREIVERVGERRFNNLNG